MFTGQFPVFIDACKQNDRCSDTHKFIEFLTLIRKVFDFEDDNGGLSNNFPVEHYDGVEDADKTFDLKASLDQNGAYVCPFPVIIVDDPDQRPFGACHKKPKKGGDEATLL